MSKDRETPAAPGARPATIKDVARAAGVGVSTASRFVSGRGYVGEAARARIAAAIAALDYRPNAAASALRGAHSRTIGVLVPDIANPLFAEIIGAFEAEARRHGFDILIGSSSARAENEVELVRGFLAHNVDALVAIPCGEANGELAALFGGLQVPVVMLDRDLLRGAERGRIGHVLSDHGPGMTAALEHLARTGHRTVALLHSAYARPGRERGAAFDAALKALHADGAALTGKRHTGSQYSSFAFGVTRVLATGDGLPDAIIVGHNQMLPGVLRALRQSGVQVGRDISLVSCDRTDLAEFHSPAIALIRRDLNAVGVAAFELLRRLEQEPGPLVVTLPTHFQAEASIRDLTASEPGAPPAT